MVFLDPRIRRTRRALQDAFLDLITSRPLEEISIQDITSRADINRATFYLHYKNREELAIQTLDELFREMVSEGEQLLNPPGYRANPQSVPPFLVHLFGYMDERKGIFRALLAHDTPTALSERLRAVQEGAFLTAWNDLGSKPLPGGPPPELRARAAASAALGMIAWWLTNEDSVPPATMARWVWTLGSHYLFKDIQAAGE